MTSETSSETRCGIGARLRSGRERAGLTVLQAAEKLHIDSRMLEALEAEQFETLGAPVFVRGHLRNYADLIGEPFAELWQLFDSGRRASEPDLTRAPRAPRVFDRGKLIKPALYVLLAGIVACAVWWVLMRERH